MMIWATGMTATASFRYAGVLALLGVTLVWGTTFPAMKLLANDVPALHILALRFGLASVVLLPLFVRLRGAEWRWGLVLGLRPRALAMARMLSFCCSPSAIAWRSVS